MLEIAIIGAGPAGLSAGINAIARGKTVRIFSSESNYLLRAEKVNNYLGLYDVDGRQMMEQFLSHARAMGVVPEKGKAANILPMGEYFLLNVDGEMVEAKTVILATGVSSAKEIPGERELLGIGAAEGERAARTGSRLLCHLRRYAVPGKKRRCMGFEPGSGERGQFSSGDRRFRDVCLRFCFSGGPCRADSLSFRSSKAGEREGKGGGRLSEWAGAAGGWTIYSSK